MDPFRDPGAVDSRSTSSRRRVDPVSEGPATEKPATIDVIAGLHHPSAPDRIRTCDLRLRRPTLYPSELRAQFLQRTNVRPTLTAGQGEQKRAAPGRRTRHERRVSARNKPSSVPAEAGQDHFSGAVVTDGLERPTRDSDGAGHPSSLIWPCSGWGLPCGVRRRTSGALLPHRFTLACASSRGPSAVCSLLHFPSPRARGARVLPGTVPCGARTFLRRSVRPKPSPAGDPDSRARSGYPVRVGPIR